MNTEEKQLLEKILLSINNLSNSLQTYEPNNGYKIVLFLVPIFGIVFGSFFLCFIFYFWYKQRMELIKNGLYKPLPFDFRAYSFFIGLLLTFTGLVLSIVFILILGRSLAMLGGLIPFSVGISLLVYYKLNRF
jgi:hypothetical protein